MKQFEIVLDDRPGELATLTSALTHVNIRNLTAEKSHGGKSIVRLITTDEASTRSILTREKFTFGEEEVILVGLLDRPGELAKLARMLGSEQINIDALHLIDRSLFGLIISQRDIGRAKELLRDSILDA